MSAHIPQVYDGLTQWIDVSSSQNLVVEFLLKQKENTTMKDFEDRKIWLVLWTRWNPTHLTVKGPALSMVDMSGATCLIFIMSEVSIAIGQRSTSHQYFTGLVSCASTLPNFYQLSIKNKWIFKGLGTIASVGTRSMRHKDSEEAAK